MVEKKITLICAIAHLVNPDLSGPAILTSQLITRVAYLGVLKRSSSKFSEAKGYHLTQDRLYLT